MITMAKRKVNKMDSVAEDIKEIGKAVDRITGYHEDDQIAEKLRKLRLKLHRKNALSGIDDEILFAAMLELQAKD